MKKCHKRVATLLLAFTGALALVPATFVQADKGLKVKSDFITTPDGIKIHYIEAGTGPAMLFVPGWTMPAEIWEKQIAYFAKTHRVVAMDPRSQGDSTKAADGNYPAAHARDIRAVVDQLKLAPVVLVGWSMGATELAAYVDQFGTSTLARLVFVDGYAGADFDPDFTAKMRQWAAGFQTDRRKQTEEFVHSMYKRPQTEEYFRRVTEAALLTPTNTAMALFVGAFTSDCRPALAKIDKPTLIVAAQSPWVNVYQDMQKRIAGSRIEVFENVGHALFVDDPDRFNSLLDEFLKSLTK